MGPWLVGVKLCCNFETTFFPACCRRESFLLRSTVGTRCIEFVVAARLELAEDLFVGIKRCDAGTFGTVLYGFEKFDIKFALGGKNIRARRSYIPR